MNTQLVVFDMAGTTVTDKGNINECFRNAFASEGLEVSIEDVNKVMGYRKIEAVDIIVRKYAPNKDRVAAVYKIHEIFNKNMVAFYESDTTLQPMPHTLKIFSWLYEQSIQVALNTGFTRDITQAILKRLGWVDHPHIQSVICSDEVPEGRPHSFMIDAIMERLGIHNSNSVIKVGDTEVDILEGRNAGCGKVIAVTTGAYTRKELEQYNPDYIIDSLSELPALIVDL